ncbi:MAG: TrmB family transcriptional regulator, partial [Candidatus Hodarchaeota archaeon]
MKEIIEQLSEIGFKENDAKVYIALLELGKSNPTKISKKTNIIRARVYDSLKRLVKQGYIEREAVNHAPAYVALNPDVVISNIKKKLTENLAITEQLPNFIKETIKIEPDKGTWAIRGIPKIKSKIEEIISQTNKELLALIT